MRQPSQIACTASVLASFLAGVALASLVGGWPVAVGLAAAGVLAFLVRKWLPAGALLALVLLGLAAGVARAELARHVATPATVDFYNDRAATVTLIGTVVEEPDRRSDHTKLTLVTRELELPHAAPQHVTGRVLLRVPRLPAYAYGDRLRVTGRLETPFETAEFSYRDYLARYAVFSFMRAPRIEKVASGDGNPLLAKLFIFKSSFEAAIGRVWPEPEASLLAGLLTGTRRGLPPDVTADFNTTGLTHIVAVSGYNIALVIAFAVAVFGRYLPRRWQFAVVAFCVVSFTLLVGAGPPVVRAAVMGLLAFFALTSGRQYHAGLGLLFAASGMVAWTPAILLSDVSFQLSTAAVAGLIYLAPILEKWLARVPQRLALRESLVLTLAAQFSAAPLLLLYFDRLSLVAPLANLLAAPAIPLAMLTGAVATGLGWLWLPAGLLLGAVTHGLLAYLLLVAEKLAAVPGASLTADGMTVGLLAVYYALLAVGVGWWQHQNRASEAARVAVPS